MIINEKELIHELNNTKNALLIEPSYIRKYIPMGLAKIAEYFKQKNTSFVFKRNCFQKGDFSHIYITSLFTYDAAITLDEISIAIKEFPKAKIIIGGIYASLMPEHILKKYPIVSVFTSCSPFLDSIGMDYSTNWFIQSKWSNYSFIFSTRGCVNKCKYCAVKIVEKNKYIIQNWKKQIDLAKKNIMIFDNNLSSFSEKHTINILNYFIKLDKLICFDNGFDCKYIDKSLAKLLGKIKFINSGMRLSFDRITEDGIFQKAVKLLLKNNIPKSQITSYVLFNFNDTPKDANYRMEECKQLGIRPYPQKFIPLNSISHKNNFIGKYWTHRLVREFRYFWLMAGYYKKMTFEEYSKKKNILNKKDWDAWYA